MLRKSILYVFDLFVEVSSGAAVPIKYESMVGDAINLVAEREKEASYVRLSAANQHVDGRDSERGREVQANGSRKTTIW